MEKVDLICDDVVSQTQRVLAERGRFSTAIPGFVSRPEQIELSVQIAKAIEDKTLLVAEAGTGTGKTFAYLVPSLLSGKKTILSTATKTLQDQLFHKDVPLLTRALGLSARVQNLKGRANYICRYRTQLYAEEGHFDSKECVEGVQIVREKMAQLKDGVRSELPEIHEESKVWPWVTSTSDNCLGKDCPSFKDCFLTKARKKALEADVVVINHHLFFADAKLKDTGFAELLPGADVVIFDEAHQLAEVAANFYGMRLSTRQVRTLIDDIIREWPILDLANQPLKKLRVTLNSAIDHLLILLANFPEKVSWDRIKHQKEIFAAFDELEQVFEALDEVFQQSSDTDLPGLTRCQERLEEFSQILKRWLSSESRQIRWIERYKQTLVWNATPYELAQDFRQQIKRLPGACVFTSATLTASGTFEHFVKPLGLTEAKTLSLASPFNFEEQALLYLPRGLPDPKDHQYYDCLLNQAIPIIEALKGRCFFLFTSHKALNLVANKLKQSLDYPLLVQGDEAKPILLAKFREHGNAVLLGTATFWEGVDVKGEALSGVIIDKLPFSSPVDPVVRGKMDYLKSQGLSGFDELALPSAILALKQGVGRLIRGNEDKGVLMIADPRLSGRAYGRQILTSLPKMKRTRDKQVVMDFIKKMVS